MLRGTLIVVGTGMKLAQQCTPEARHAIEDAEIVYAAGADKIAHLWLEQINANTISLQPLYGQGRSRAETYAAMSDAILTSVRAGKRVCAVFYGHPGVFVTPSHDAIRRAREEGYDAHMLPGICAEDCLYADLEIDPGSAGRQSFEATDFIVNARTIDTGAHLIIWQIAVAADLSFQVLEPDPRRLAVLSEVLMEQYPADHEVTIYEAATLPVGAPQIARLRLRELNVASVSQASTLYVPPATPVRPSPQRLALLKSRLG